MPLIRAQVEAALDQWMASIKEQRAKGEMPATQDALAQHLGRMFGFGDHPPQGPIQHMLIMLAHAIHRLLLREAERMADNEH
jgi:hypothetical protein